MDLKLKACKSFVDKAQATLQALIVGWQKTGWAQLVFEADASDVFKALNGKMGFDSSGKKTALQTY